MLAQQKPSDIVYGLQWGFVIIFLIVPALLVGM